MIGISKLYCGTVEPSDAIRYGRDSKQLPSHLLQFSADKKPVVVWNCTRRCNLRCVHCYSHSQDLQYSGEMSNEEAKRFIDGLGDFGVPVLLFSGGEPLLRRDLFELITYTRNKGIRAVISTNGTLISEETAARLADAGLSYVGVSLDGLKAVHDRFRGVAGSFEKALEGIRASRKAGVKVGLRFTINKDNVDDIPGIFRLLETESIPRICFYHLVYTGRAAELVDRDLDRKKARETVDLIINATADLHKRGFAAEVLTVDNHADGVHLYLRLLREKSPRAAQVLELLKMNGGNSSGVGISSVSWDGSVYPDQFWRHYAVGNVRERPFGEIWSDPGEPLLAKLRDRKAFLKGRCGRCVWRDICNGNFRVRAEAVYNDVWAEDPACYLTEEEISTRVE
ncbi:MAG: 12,18-didecarboxysiroheme deacetylase [Chitinispirillaceae bacterium]|nr:12,18-didecarboxysiroheme deacetylase [Chitinispirillaceae bacterium]